MKSFLAVYYTKDGHRDICPLYSVTLEDALQEVSNEIICPYVKAEVIEDISPRETIDQYNARVKEYALVET